MQQLIELLTEEYNISREEATAIINVVANYAVEKSPQLENALRKIFSSETEETNGQAYKTSEKEQYDTTEQPSEK